MELWIRVQKNKKLIQGLVKIDNLFVDTDIDNKWCIQQSGDTLGIYKTKERALEVLDEIQNILKPTFVCDPITREITSPTDHYKKYECVEYLQTIQEFPTYVYEMPLD